MLVIMQIIYVMYKGGLPLVCHCLARKEPGIYYLAGTGENYTGVGAL